MSEGYEGDPPYPDWFLAGYKPFIAGGSGLLVCPRCKGLVSADKYAKKEEKGWYVHTQWHLGIVDLINEALKR